MSESYSTGNVDTDKSNNFDKSDRDSETNTYSGREEGI
jgi:hypothetical protein